VAEGEPVTSPDQHKQGNRRRWRIAGVVSIVLILLMNFGNHQGHVETLWLFGVAGLLAVMIIGDEVLRRNGLRR
jgi:Protein of unknown function (DUF2631)